MLAYLSFKRGENFMIHFFNKSYQNVIFESKKLYFCILSIVLIIPMCNLHNCIILLILCHFYNSYCNSYNCHSLF